jgi:hypothetical protein
VAQDSKKETLRKPPLTFLCAFALTCGDLWLQVITDIFKLRCPHSSPVTVAPSNHPFRLLRAKSAKFLPNQISASFKTVPVPETQKLFTSAPEPPVQQAAASRYLFWRTLSTSLLCKSIYSVCNCNVNFRATTRKLSVFLINHLISYEVMM